MIEIMAEGGDTLKSRWSGVNICGGGIAALRIQKPKHVSHFANFLNIIYLNWVKLNTLPISNRRRRFRGSNRRRKSEDFLKK